MTDAAPSKACRSHFWGPLSALGLVVAASVLLADQALKLWLLHGFRLIPHFPDPLAPFVNLTLTWNTGISYGLLPQAGPLGKWTLFGFEILVVAFLWVWLSRVASRLGALALGLIVGGALGNAADRLHWPGVMDFVDLHVGTFHWYVFNLADVAIVAGVAALLYESLLGGEAVKSPRSGV
jgi:signal peptidase II